MKSQFLSIAFSVALIFSSQIAVGQIYDADDVKPTETETAPDNNDVEAKEKKNGKKAKTPRHLRDTPILDRFYVGGMPNLGISNYFFVFSMETEAGFMLGKTERVAIGAKFGYSFQRDSRYEPAYGATFKYNILKYGPYARAYIWEGLFAQVEYEFFRIASFAEEDPNNNVLVINPANVSTVFVGGGWHDNFSQGFGYYISILGVAYKSTQIYPSAVVRFGMTYSF